MAEKFGMAVGIWGGVSAVAIAAGPIVAGILVARVSWESVIYLNAPIALIGLVFGVVQSGSWGWSSGRTWTAILVGMLVLTAFGYAESRVSEPLIPLTLLRSTGVSVGGLSSWRTSSPCSASPSW